MNVFLTGLILSIISAIFFSFGDLINKKISNNYKIIKSILFISFFNSFISFLLLIIFDEIYLINLKQFSILLFTGFLGYIALYSFIKSFTKNSVGITISISNLYPILIIFFNFIFFQEMINLFFFIPIIMIVISIVIYINFNFKENFNFIIYPILTCIGWGVFTFVNFYLINYQKISIYNSVFYLEFFVFLFSIVIFFHKYIIDKKNYNINFNLKKINKKIIFFTFLSSFFPVISQLFFGKSIEYINVSISSSILTSQIILASIGAYFVYNEKLKTREKISILILIIALILFYLIEYFK